MAAVDELKSLLDDAVAESVGIDAVFVYDLKNSFLLHRSTQKRAEDLLSSDAMASFGGMKNVKPALDAFAKGAKRGDFQYAIFQLEQGILNIYFETFGTKPFAVGFISASAEGTGSLLHYSQKYIEKIRPLLTRLL
ncbi:MAG: hypothetical protein BWK78_01970 [Thiotrichaceae bacterium IS1]|nr:MAG: hypothetical protein BWK78_01970 [Thiotrichaceae bacterium IS1]